jgi:NADPH:quinone reductase-like Zn-dependent oxidoreductase
MRAMRAEGFRGYEDLKLAEIPKPGVLEGRVLVRITAAGVMPLDHTILSGGYPKTGTHCPGWSPFFDAHSAQAIGSPIDEKKK